MYDAFCYYAKQLDGSELQEIVDFDGNKVDLPERFYYMTCHRQENTDTDDKLDQIFQTMEVLDAPTLHPVYPRNHARAERLLRKNGYKNVLLASSVGYKTSISLVNRAEKIVTDSGGLQRETFFTRKPCVTVFDFVAWPETMKDDCNQLAKPDNKDFLDKLQRHITLDSIYLPFGDGHSSEKIVNLMGEFLR